MSIGRSLSARQEQILKLLSAGHSNKEIARLLGLTEGTVKQHAYALFRKIGVKNRAQAAVQGRVLQDAVALRSANGSALPESVFAATVDLSRRAATAGRKRRSQGAGGSAEMPASPGDSTPSTSKATAASRAAGAPQASNPDSTANPTHAASTASTGASAAPQRRWRRASDAPSYGLRLVTAVVVEPRTAAVRSGKEAQTLSEQLASLGNHAFELADIFDGTPQELPGGAMAVFFGQAASHGDDPARALAYARALAGHGKGLDKVRLGLGLATRPELVDQRDNTAVAASAYRRALQLAQHSAPGQLLACFETARLSGIRTEDMPSAQVHGGAEDEGEWAPLVLPAERPADPLAPSRWAGLPAAQEIRASLMQRKTQWVAIESWPPEDATRLMETLGDVFEQQRLPVIRLWMPSDRDPLLVQSKLIAQWQRIGGSTPLRTKAPAAQAMEVALQQVADRAPAVLLIHGQDALPTLWKLLPDAVFDRLAGAGVAIVGTKVQNTGAAQTSLRLLGSYPYKAPFSVVHRLPPVRRRAGPQSAMQPGTQAVLDRLSDPERKLLTALVRHPQRKRRDLAKLAGLPRTQADQACAQLESAGLLTPNNDLLAFRDAHTEAAIRASMLPAGG